MPGGLHDASDIIRRFSPTLSGAQLLIIYLSREGYTDTETHITMTQVVFQFV